MESDKIAYIIRIASNLSVILPLAIYFSRITHATRKVHIIGCLILVSTVCDLAGFVFYKENLSTVVLFNVYYAITFLLLSWYYYEVLFSNNRRLTIWVGLAIYFQSFILITIFVQSFFEYQTLMWVITAVIAIIYGIAYFIYTMPSIYASADFSHTFTWINTGVLLYFCLNLFLFVMSNYVLTAMDAEMGLLIWAFHNVNNILKNIFFAIGIYIYKRTAVSF
jgi:hypothetical protein